MLLYIVIRRLITRAMSEYRTESEATQVPLNNSKRVVDSYLQGAPIVRLLHLIVHIFKVS